MKSQQSVMKCKVILSFLTFIFFTTMTGAVWAQSDSNYIVVDTGQDKCYNNSEEIPSPNPGTSFYGQDAQYDGVQPTYQDNGDGTVTDLNTGLMWQKTPDLDNKSTYTEAVAGASTFRLAGYDDWRLPSIKELYSLINFNGMNGLSANDSTPYIDTDYFDFEYGDTSAGERFIDAQYCSSTKYVSTTMNGDETVFGVNFADGRIKGYPSEKGKTFFVRYVRGNPDYGVNDFSDNGDGTITNNATGLMWSQADSGEGMDWEYALAWGQQKNDENYLDYNDWRLPNAKELQSIVDYTRSPATTNSAAIDPIFSVTSIIDEGGGMNYPFYWTSTTHLVGPPDVRGGFAVYIAFGEALGFMEMPPNSGNRQLLDVHGAGAQRSAPKSGDPNDWPNGHGPQGDVIRIYNYIRCVRTALSESENQAGDVNEDGEITVYDARLVLQYIVGLIDLGTTQKQAADVNNNGNITALDAVLILQRVVGLIAEFPADKID